MPLTDRPLRLRLSRHWLLGLLACTVLCGCPDNDDEQRSCIELSEWHDALMFVEFGRLVIADTQGAVVRVLPSYHELSPPVWSPCKDLIAVLPVEEGNCVATVGSPNELDSASTDVSCLHDAPHIIRMERGAWSPDGNRLVFTGYDDLGHRTAPNAYVLDASIGNPASAQYRKTADSIGICSFVDDRSIVGEYYYESGGMVQRSWIAKLDIVSGNRTLLVSDSTNDPEFNGPLKSFYLPTTGPGGNLIAFVFTHCVGCTDSSEIWLMDADGSNKRLIGSVQTFGSAIQTMSFSPDGKVLLFHPDDKGEGELYLAKTDGSGVSKVPGTFCEEGRNTADWSPDSRWIVYEEASEHYHGIAVIRPDGTGYRRISENGQWPDW